MTKVIAVPDHTVAACAPLRIGRRDILSVMAATTLFGGRSEARSASTPTWLYNSVGSRVMQFEVDATRGRLVPGASIDLPSAVQYAWIHPGRRFIYACASDGTRVGSGPSEPIHRLCALRVDGDGSLALHGAPLVLDRRPIHISVDRSGRFALTCFPTPAGLTVHRIDADGALGERIAQPSELDCGRYPHQILATPTNRSVALVTRGNDASGGRAEDPGAIKLFRFCNGRLSPLQDIRSGAGGGLGYGPRHLDFHPDRPWVYVALERENQLHMYRLDGSRFSPQPSYAVLTIGGDPRRPRQTLAGAIHCHPRGHVVYVSNRASKTVQIAGREVFAGGVNSIAVFALDRRTGAPTLVQEIDPQAYEVRTFAIDPTGTLLVAAASVDMNVRVGDGIRHVPAALSLFRIADDGRLGFLRKYDVPLKTGDKQLWVNMLAGWR